MNFYTELKSKIKTLCEENNLEDIDTSQFLKELFETINPNLNIDVVHSQMSQNETDGAFVDFDIAGVTKDDVLNILSIWNEHEKKTAVSRGVEPKHFGFVVSWKTKVEEVNTIRLALHAETVSQLVPKVVRNLVSNKSNEMFMKKQKEANSQASLLTDRLLALSLASSEMNPEPETILPPAFNPELVHMPSAPPMSFSPSDLFQQSIGRIALQHKLAVEEVKQTILTGMLKRLKQQKGHNVQGQLLKTALGDEFVLTVKDRNNSFIYKEITDFLKKVFPALIIKTVNIKNQMQIQFPIENLGYSDLLQLYQEGTPMNTPMQELVVPSEFIQHDKTLSDIINYLQINYGIGTQHCDVIEETFLTICNVPEDPTECHFYGKDDKEEAITTVFELSGLKSESIQMFCNKLSEKTGLKPTATPAEMGYLVEVDNRALKALEPQFKEQIDKLPKMIEKYQQKTIVGQLKKIEEHLKSQCQTFHTELAIQLCDALSGWIQGRKPGDAYRAQKSNPSGVINANREECFSYLEQIEFSFKQIKNESLDNLIKQTRNSLERFVGFKNMPTLDRKKEPFYDQTSTLRQFDSPWQPPQQQSPTKTMQLSRKP